MTSAEKMRRLAEQFPTLRGVPGTSPWDAAELLRWLSGPAPTHGSRQAALFLLAVWNSSADWRKVARESGVAGWRAIEPFQAVRAMATWDSAHRAAFQSWVNDPFFP